MNAPPKDNANRLAIRARSVGGTLPRWSIGRPPFGLHDLIRPEQSRTRRWSDSAAYRALGKGAAVRSILVLKVDHIGDFILSLDALLRLREAFPDATLDFACGPWNVDLARSTGLFDNVYTIPFFNARPDQPQPAFDPSFLAELDGMRWDLAIDLRADADTRLLLRHIAAQWKMGFESPGNDDFMTMTMPHGITGAASSVAMNQSLVILRLVNTIIAVFHRPDDVRALLCNQVAAACDIDLSAATGRHLVGCNLSSGRFVKDWPLARFKTLIAWLAVELDCVVVLLGDGMQTAKAEEVVTFCGSPHVISAVGRTSLREAIGIIARCSIYIGNDTGLTHIAARLQIPAVALMPGIDPTAVFAPLSRTMTILSAPTSCSPCHISHFRDCVGDHACMLNISEQAVRRAVLDQLLTAPVYDGRGGAAPLPAETGTDQPHPRLDSAFRRWIASEQFETPQRYGQNHARYLAQGGRLDLQDLMRGFTKGNDNNRGDINRFYALALIFDQIMKEQIQGDLAELGVYKGNTAYMLADFARRTGATAYLLDTFEGFSAEDLQGIDANKRFEFADTSLDGVKALVGSAGVHYVKGYFPGTATQIPGDARFALVHIDCDLYAPFVAALEFFYPRLMPGGFFIMHDYASLHWDGAERAVDEFFADKPESVMPLPDGSGTVVVRKLKAADPQRNWFVQSRTNGFANAWVNASSHPTTEFLTSGWGEPEPWGTWGLGPSQLLTLLLLDPAPVIELAIESQLPLCHGREHGWVDVTVGGRHLARWDYGPECNSAVRILRIEREMLVPRQNRLFAAELEFRPNSSQPPRDIDPSSAETRPLGLGLLRFRQRALSD
jgi:ADP-heptose:LPS heptosyltransferase